MNKTARQKMLQRIEKDAQLNATIKKVADTMNPSQPGDQYAHELFLKLVNQIYDSPDQNMDDDVSEAEDQLPDEEDCITPAK